MFKKLLLSLSACLLFAGSALARPVTEIQADITVTQAQLTKEQADIPPLQAKLVTLNAELAAATSTKSPDLTTITPNSGQIVDQNKTIWTVKTDKKIYRSGVVVTSSGGVEKLVFVYADGPGLRQYNGRDWWTQPLAGGPGTITSAPGGVVVPPVVIPPVSGKGPITGWTKVQFQDTFTNLNNWTRTFPGQAPTGTYAYGYGNRGLSNGYAIDPSFVCNPVGYPPAAGMEDPVKLQPGGGVQLNTYKNPRWSTGQFKTPDALPDMGKWCASWLWTKIPVNVGVEITVEFTLSDWSGGKQIGSWPAIWLISNQDWSEIDMLDGLMANPDFPGRAWFAAGAPNGWNMCGGSCPVDGNMKPGRNVISLKLTSDNITVMFNGVIVKNASQPNAFRQPLYLGVQELMGGWDHNNDQSRMAARTSTTYHSVTIRVP